MPSAQNNPTHMSMWNSVGEMTGNCKRASWGTVASRAERSWQRAVPSVLKITYTLFKNSKSWGILKGKIRNPLQCGLFVSNCARRKVRFVNLHNWRRRSESSKKKNKRLIKLNRIIELLVSVCNKKIKCTHRSSKRLVKQDWNFLSTILKNSNVN